MRLKDDLNIQIDKKTQAESVLIKSWVAHSLETKLNAEIRSTKNWTSQQIKNVRDWFHVPGVIGSKTNTGLDPTYESYTVYIKEMVKNKKEVEENLAKLQELIEEADNKRDELAELNEDEFLKLGKQLEKDQKDLMSSMQNDLYEVKVEAA